MVEVQIRPVFFFCVSRQKAILGQGKGGTDRHLLRVTADLGGLHLFDGDLAKDLFRRRIGVRICLRRLVYDLRNVASLIIQVVKDWRVQELIGPSSINHLRRKRMIVVMIIG